MVAEVAADSAARSVEVAVSPAPQRDRAVKLESRATVEGRGSVGDTVSVPTSDKKDEKVKNKFGKKDPKVKYEKYLEGKIEIDPDDL